VTQNQIPARFIPWLKQKRMAIATVWYVVTILLLALVGKTLYKVRTVGAVTCCAASSQCGGAGQCQLTYSCPNMPPNPSIPHMCC
jgi:hypothetical protein